MYRDGRGVNRVVVLPDDDRLVVDVGAWKDGRLVIKAKDERYDVLVSYVHDGQLRPVRAMVSNFEIVSMLNLHFPLMDTPHKFFMRGGDYEQ